MKINFLLLDRPIIIKKMTTLVLEDVRVFSQVVELLYQYNEDSELKIFDQKLNNIKETELIIITDILGYSLNSLALQKIIYTDLEEQLNDKIEVRSMIDRAVLQINELIEYELIEHELNLGISDLNLQQLFKTFDIKIVADENSIFDKILEIIKVFKYLTKKKLLIFVNALSYLLPEELSELSNYISLSNTKVLFLEPREIKGLSQYILDNDYFLTEQNDIIM